MPGFLLRHCECLQSTLGPSHTPDHIPACCLFLLRALLEEVLSIMKLSFAFLMQSSPHKDRNSGSGRARGWEFEGQEEIRHISTLYPDSALLRYHINLHYSDRFPPPPQLCSLWVTFASPCTLTSLVPRLLTFIKHLCMYL